MKKYIGLFLLLFLTGCSVNYKVLINEDLSVSESVKIYGTEDLYDEYYKTTKINVLKDLLDNYQDILKENNYQYSLNDEVNPFINVNRNYNNINDYIDKSLLFNDYFDKINYTKDDNIIKIETEGFHPNNPDDPGRFYIEDLTIAITPSYEVSSHNASKFDKKTNTCYFEIKEDTEDFKILLEINLNNKFNANRDTIIMIIVGIIIVILSWVFVFYKNKKKYI